MSQLINLLLLLGLFLSFYNNGESKEFCQTFVDNNDSFDYGISVPNKQMLYIIIDNYYWKLNADYVNGFVNISRIGNQTDWFGSKYQLAFSYKHYQYYRIGLYDKRDESIVWGLLSPKAVTNNHLLITKVNPIESSKFTLFAFNPSVAYQSSYLALKGSHTIIFMEQLYDNGINGFVRRLQFYQFENMSKPVNETNSKEVKRKFIPKFIKDIDKSLYVTALYGDFVDSDKFKGAVILFNYSKTIKYCMTREYTIHSNCKPIELRELINCSQFTPSTIPITRSTTEEITTEEMTTEEMTTISTDSENNTNLVIIVVVILITTVCVVILIIILISILTGNQNTKSQVKTTPSTTTGLSTISFKPKKKTPKESIT